METPVEIEFQGMQGLPGDRDFILAHVGKLEEHFGRITACRIVVRAPTSHHRSGTPFSVHIRLTLPSGREVNVGQRPSTDEREAILHFAVNQAFKRARRALQDNVRRMRGDVKRHDTRSTPPAAAE